jgi:CTP synthase
MGISPDIIVARADEPLSQDSKHKISRFCNVKLDCVIENATMPSLYEVPIMLHKNGLDEVACRELGLDAPAPDLGEWAAMAENISKRQKEVCIAIVGKYVQLHDAYLSIIESLNHAGIETAANVSIRWIDSEEVTNESVRGLFSGINGVIVPGGFGDRGIEGKIAACHYARENDLPFFGICLGMQVAVIEFSRNVCGLEGAHSAEFNEASLHRVIDIMPDQVGREGTGGTMRLGAYPCRISPGSLLGKLYGASEISERHRHRFELNNDYREILTSKGLKISGFSPDGSLVEAIELPGHSFFVGVQFHPEFKSRPNKPAPLFVGLLKAACGPHADLK